jgi:hypothetical protein
MRTMNWIGSPNIASKRRTQRRRSNDRSGKFAAAMLLESRIGERFNAIVTGASDQGTWVRLLHPPIEGKPVFRVQLSRTDVERGYIDFKSVG